MELLRPNAERAKKTILFIWIAMACDIIAFGSGLMQYSLLSNAADGLGVSTEEASANDLREQIISIIQLLVICISGVYFIMWFRRAYFNLSQLTTLNYTDGWAAGCWFVPILSLYRPYQMMKELYFVTEGVLVKQGKPTDMLPTSKLGIWWALYIVNSLLGQITFRFASKAETIDQLQDLTIVGLVNNIIGIPLAIITVKVVKDYVSVESLLDGKGELYDNNSDGEGALDQGVF